VGGFFIAVRTNGSLVDAEKMSILRAEWQGQAQHD
jgi:hypothetical protein